jgi:hypothetical protein
MCPPEAVWESGEVSLWRTRGAAKKLCSQELSSSSQEFGLSGDCGINGVSDEPPIQHPS